MYLFGHIGGALLFYSPVAILLRRYFRTRTLFVGGLVAVVFSTVPDFDRFITTIAHRGVTHTLWFGILAATVIGIATLCLAALVFRRSIGIALFAWTVIAVSSLSHLVFDAITPGGISPLLPVDSFHITFSLTSASNPTANRLLLLSGLVVFGATVVILRRRDSDTA